MVLIRNATPSDYTAIVGIVNRIDPEPISAEELHLRDQQMLVDETVNPLRVVIEKTGGTIVGYGAADPHTGAESKIWTIRVAVDC